MGNTPSTAPIGQGLDLIEEFELALGEMRIGESRLEALKKMSERSASQEMASFVRAIIQADQLGISLGRILRIQAETHA